MKNELSFSRKDKSLENITFLLANSRYIILTKKWFVLDIILITYKPDIKIIFIFKSMKVWKVMEKNENWNNKLLWTYL